MILAVCCWGWSKKLQFTKDKYKDEDDDISSLLLGVLSACRPEASLLKLPGCNAYTAHFKFVTQSTFLYLYLYLYLYLHLYLYLYLYLSEVPCYICPIAHTICNILKENYNRVEYLIFNLKNVNPFAIPEYKSYQIWLHLFDFPPHRVFSNEFQNQIRCGRLSETTLPTPPLVKS